MLLLVDSDSSSKSGRNSSRMSKTQSSSQVIDVQITKAEEEQQFDTHLLEHHIWAYGLCLLLGNTLIDDSIELLKNLVVLLHT